MAAPPADFTTEQFLLDRGAALRSLDRDQILAYMTKYGITPPEDGEKFWGAVHKARCWCADFTDDEKRVSTIWLTEHGFRVV